MVVAVVVVVYVGGSGRCIGVDVSFVVVSDYSSGSGGSGSGKLQL